MRLKGHSLSQSSSQGPLLGCLTLILLRKWNESERLRAVVVRTVLGLLLGGPGLPYVGQQTIVTPKPDANCGICGNPAVFDNWLDTNLCPKCGAQESANGWQQR